jgi:hypothetical protein
MLIVIVGLFVLSTLFVTRVRHEMPDFEVYWRAGVRARSAEPLYRVEDGHYVLKYLPAFALLMLPFGALPLPVAKAVWFGGSLALLALLLHVSRALLPERKVRSGLIVLVTVVALAKFYARELSLGQSNLLMVALVVLALAQIRAGRALAAGALVGLAVLVKPYAVIFLPYLVVRLRRASAGMAAVLAAGLVLPTVSYGLAGTLAETRAWADMVVASTPANLVNPDNVSVFGMYAKWLGVGGPATWLALATAAVLLLSGAAACVRPRGLVLPEYLEFSLLLILIPLLSPQGWDYVFLVSTPAVMCLVNSHREMAPGLRAVVGVALFTIGFSVFDLMGRSAYSTFMSWSIITLCYLVLVAALAILRARRLA